MYTLAGALGATYDKDCWKACYYNRPEGEGSYAANQRCIAQCGGGVVQTSGSSKWWIIGAGVVAVGAAVVFMKKRG